MKKLNIPLIFTFFAIIFVCCKPETKNISPTSSNNGQPDLENAVTPYGEKLLPAEEGPVRSALGVPGIDLSTFKLEITGLVDTSFNLTWDRIRNLQESFSENIVMYCIEGWDVWGKWEGILVRDLLAKAHVQPEGKYVLFSGADGYTTSLPISYLEKYNALLAYNVNGSPLKMSDGFPLRLIAFGKYGYKWAKWVNKLKIINMSQAGYWETEGFPDKADVPMYRRSFYEGKNAKPLEY